MEVEVLAEVLPQDLFAAVVFGTGKVLVVVAAVVRGVCVAAIVALLVGSCVLGSLVIKRRVSTTEVEVVNMQGQGIFVLVLKRTEWTAEHIVIIRVMLLCEVLS